jgi:hypothetical protein
MAKELKTLLDKYPKIFKGPRKYPFAFECGDGWYDIIDRLCSNAQMHIKYSRDNRARALRYNRALSLVNQGAPIETLARALSHNRTVTDYTLKWAQEEVEKGQFKAVPDAVPQIVALQVKEKFGTLRFYYGGGDSMIEGLVRMAESISGVTCEVCGNAGEIGGERWLQTLCEKHRNEGQ